MCGGSSSPGGNSGNDNKRSSTPRYETKAQTKARVTPKATPYDDAIMRAARNTTPSKPSSPSNTSSNSSGRDPGFGREQDKPTRPRDTRLSPGAAVAVLGQKGAAVAGQNITADSLANLKQRAEVGQLSGVPSAAAMALNAIGQFTAKRMLDNLMAGETAVTDRKGNITGTRNERGQLTGRDPDRVTGDSGSDDNNTPVQPKPKPKPKPEDTTDNRNFGDQLASAGYNALLVNRSGTATDRTDLRVKKTKGQTKNKGVGLNVVKV